MIKRASISVFLRNPNRRFLLASVVSLPSLCLFCYARVHFCLEAKEMHYRVESVVSEIGAERSRLLQSYGNLHEASLPHP